MSLGYIKDNKYKKTSHCVAVKPYFKFMVAYYALNNNNSFGFIFAKSTDNSVIASIPRTATNDYSFKVLKDIPNAIVLCEHRTRGNVQMYVYRNNVEMTIRQSLQLDLKAGDTFRLRGSGSGGTGAATLVIIKEKE